VEEDIFIRNYINEHFNLTPISKIEICRDIVDYIIRININICVARAGVIASRNRKSLLDLRNKLLYFLKLNFDKCIVSINLVDIPNPDSDARFLAQFARQQLERRVPFRRVIRTTILKSQKVKVKGIKVQIAGRLNGTEIARTEWVREGQVPLHTLKANIDYCSCNALKI
jgi:small subunit ribosomal protein S3